MNRLGSAIRLVFCLPPVWIALVAVAAAVVFNGWEPFVDIVLYAIQRLFLS
jgi:hypothetical protein